MYSTYIYYIQYIYSYDKKNDNLFFDLNLPKPVKLEGDYEISGKILILPIVGKGRCKLSLGEYLKKKFLL